MGLFTLRQSRARRCVERTPQQRNHRLVRALLAWVSAPIASLCAYAGPTDANLNEVKTTAKANGVFLRAPAKDWAFDVYRNGKLFGYHRLQFAPTEGGMNVTISVRLEVKLGPIQAFYYRLSCREAWQQTRLQSLQCQTRKDGKDLVNETKASATGLRVKSTAYSGALDPNILPTSWWNEETVRVRRLMSSEDGEVLDVRPILRGEEDLEIRGKKVRAKHYHIDARLPLDIWYDEHGRWVKLAFVTQNQRIEYRLSSPL